MVFGTMIRLHRTVHLTDTNVGTIMNLRCIGGAEIAWLPDETIAKFHSDFRLVADFFSQLRKKDDYDPPEDELLHVQETMELLSAVSGDDRFREAVQGLPKGERKTMKLAYLDKVEARSEARGEARGKEKTLLENIHSLMETYKLSAQQAMDALRVPQESRSRLMTLL